MVQPSFELVVEEPVDGESELDDELDDDASLLLEALSPAELDPESLETGADFLPL
jgi:hypothetical protein